MFRRNHVRRVRALGSCACAVALVCGVVAAAPAKVSAAAGPAAARAQSERLDIRMRSYAPPASGRVTIEASEGGGRGRLTALSLPDPHTVSPGARAYVVWATSEGRIVRLGELRRDERGNGGLAFERPAEFERYSVVVTAEPDAAAERPGAPALSTRAGEVATLYPRLISEGAAASPATPTTPAMNPPADAKPSTPAPDPLKVERPRARSRRPGGDFYAEVDDALAANGGGRLVEMEGELAPRARGAARATAHTGRAYVRANFRDVPLPDAVGANVYVLWAVIPSDGRIVYMGSLPAAEALNTSEIYVRTAGFDTDAFDLFVTAERQRPAPSPSGRRVLSPKTARVIVK
jgi:hypothetical protein